MKEIQFGVPPGSILGPLLFLLYINDINRSTNSGKIGLFADDTTVFISHQDPQVLKEKAEQVTGTLKKWFLANKLTLSIDKSCFCVFHLKNIIVPTTLDYLNIGNEQLKRVQHTKYLGVTIDDQLTWKYHIDIILKDLVKIAHYLE